MKSVYSDAAQLLEKEQPVVLARIIRQTGSAPRSVGTAFLMLSDGTIRGTIGGGALEYQVIEKAGAVFQSRKSAILEFRLTGRQVAETQMLCGGLVDVFLEPLSPQNPETVEVFSQARQMLRSGRRGVLVTRIASGTGSDEIDQRSLIRADGSIVGGLVGKIAPRSFAAEDLAGSQQAALWDMTDTGGGRGLFVEPLEPDSVLYLFGAGHVSTFVAAMAATVGFRVVVIDDRNDFASPERFPQADSILVSDFSRAFDQIDVTPASYIAIITRGHIHDRDVLEAALQKKPAYIGMIGSMRKRNLIYQSLLEAGVSADRIAQIHSPIGLDIAAETPEEIAVSIVAELIHVRALGPVAKEPFKSGQTA